MALDRTWEVDESNTVKLRMGGFGKKVVTVNGAEVFSGRKLPRKHEIPFHMPDGRPGVVNIKPEFMGTTINLWVSGQQMIETPKKPLKCASCGAEAKSYDRFCGKCGQAMPTAEDHQNLKKVKEAVVSIRVLAGLFFASGLLLWFATKVQADAAISKLGLREADPGTVLPDEINGRQWTAGELMKELEWEPVGVLSINLILGVSMVALSFWAKRSPLGAMLVATATYAVVLVTNAIADPATIGQAVIVKIIIIAFLIKGIRAALALRTAKKAMAARANA